MDRLHRVLRAGGMFARTLAAGQLLWTMRSRAGDWPAPGPGLAFRGSARQRKDTRTGFSRDRGRGTPVRRRAGPGRKRRSAFAGVRPGGVDASAATPRRARSTQPFRTVQKLADTLAPGRPGACAAPRRPSRSRRTSRSPTRTPSAARRRTGSRSAASPARCAKLQGRLVIADTANRITVLRPGARRPRRGDENSTQPSPQIDGDDVKVTRHEPHRRRPGGLPAASAAARRGDRVPDARSSASGSTTASRECARQYSRSLLLLDSLVYDNNSWGLRLGPDADSSFVRKVIFDGNQGNVQLRGRRGQLLERERPHPQHLLEPSGEQRPTSPRAGTDPTSRRASSTTCASPARTAPSQPFSGARHLRGRATTCAT